MSKEKIVEFFTWNCKNCPLHSDETGEFCATHIGISCVETQKQYLNEEVEE